MKLPLTREELDEIEKRSLDYGISKNPWKDKFIAQARIAIELKEALDWLSKNACELVQAAASWRVQHWITKIKFGEGSTPLEAIQNAMKVIK